MHIEKIILQGFRSYKDKTVVGKFDLKKNEDLKIVVIKNFLISSSFSIITAEL